MGHPFIVGDKIFLGAIDGSDEQVAASARWVNDSEVTAHLMAGRHPMSLAAEREWRERRGRG